MDKKSWILGGIALVASVGAILFGGMLLQKNLGTGFTGNPSTSSYTDSGADWRQNLQAAVERLTGLSQYQVLQADSAGVMQAVSIGDLIFNESITLGGGGLVNGGTVTAITTSSAGAVTYVLTAAQICNSDMITFDMTGNPTSMSLTLPASSTLAATDCFDANGHRKTLVFRNIDATTSTAFSGTVTGGSVAWTSSSTQGTVAAGRDALIEVYRYGANTPASADYWSIEAR